MEAQQYSELRETAWQQQQLSEPQQALRRCPVMLRLAWMLVVQIPILLNLPESDAFTVERRETRNQKSGSVDGCVSQLAPKENT